MPDDVRFHTKPRIALEQVWAALAEGVAPGVLLADAGYGVDTAFRTGLSRLGLTYVVGIPSTASLWKPGEAPLPPKPWHTVTWREGSNTALSSRFAAIRVRPAHRDTLRSEPRPEEWFMVEWPENEAEPTKYWFSILPADTPLTDLVEIAKLRWRIERDFQTLKQELGLGHYEGRGWRGFHHHAALCIAARGSARSA